MSRMIAATGSASRPPTMPPMAVPTMTTNSTIAGRKLITLPPIFDRNHWGLLYPTVTLGDAGDSPGRQCRDHNTAAGTMFKKLRGGYRLDLAATPRRARAWRSSLAIQASMRCCSTAWRMAHGRADWHLSICFVASRTDPDRVEIHPGARIGRRLFIDHGITGHRRDCRGRRRRHALPRGDAWRHCAQPRQAPPHARGRCDRRLGRAGAGPDYDRRRGLVSAPMPWCYPGWPARRSWASLRGGIAARTGQRRGRVLRLWHDA